MNTIHAVWKNGQIVPMQPVDWPEGTPLTVEPVEQALVTDLEGDLLGDDPASIARWLAWFDELEPLRFTPEEEAAWQAARQERRNWEKLQFETRSERLRDLFE
jgi:hypothetical protein